MPKFGCTKCKREISYTDADTAFFQSRLWQCLTCYSVIAEKRYPVNVQGARTLFSPVGWALGDKILWDVVEREYLKDNPLEDVIFTHDPVHANRIMNMPHDKVFWADVTNFMQRPAFGDGIYHYCLTVEVSTYAEKGIYPTWPEFEEYPVVQEPYIVISARNIAKGEYKNIESDYFNSILNLLDDFHVYLVGNDNPVDGEALRWNAIDLRHKLNLNEIAFICKNAKLFIGKDNGIIHLAAASGCKNIVSWGYQSELWFPKTDKKNYTSFVKPDSIKENVLNAINKRLEI